MHDTERVRRRQRFENLDPGLQRLTDRQGAPATIGRPVFRRRQTPSPGIASRRRRSLDADVMQRAYVRMGQARDDASLALESLAIRGWAARSRASTLIATLRSSRVSRAR